MMKNYKCKECGKKLNLDQIIVVSHNSKDLFCDTQISPLEPDGCARKYVEKHLNSLEQIGGCCWIRLSDYEEFVKEGDYKVICK